jgi:hypothetical protein
MRNVSIKNGSRVLFRKLESVGCILKKCTQGGRGESTGGGTPGKQGRHVYAYEDDLHEVVCALIEVLCSAPKTCVFHDLHTNAQINVEFGVKNTAREALIKLHGLAD